MSTLLTEQLRATGVASVIAVLKAPPAPPAAGLTTRASAARVTADDLSKYFVSSELSQESALLADRPKLGVRRARRPDRPRLKRAQRPSRVTQRRPTRAGSPAISDFLALDRPAIDVQSIDEPVPPPLVRVYPNLGVALGTVTKDGLAGLRSDPGVASVMAVPPVSLIYPKRVTAARLSSRHTWGMRSMEIIQLWDQGLTGKGVTVGHLDTGVDGRHPALKDCIPVFAEFDDFGRQVIPDPAAWDSEDHGTHTAATIAGRPVNGRNIGIAPGAQLAAAIVIEGGQEVARVLGGMDWAIGRGVRILNMSLGFPGYWDDFVPVTQIVRQRGVLPVFAVGNEGPGTSRSPGNYPEALSVGAYDSDGEVAEFSSSQRFPRRDSALVPDLVGPGVGVISAKPGGGYQSMDGTSMATPHIAGLAALLLEARPESTVAELEHAILASCQLMPTMPPDRANRGVPNAPAALAALLGGTTSAA